MTVGEATEGRGQPLILRERIHERSAEEPSAASLAVDASQLGVVDRYVAGGLVAGQIACLVASAALTICQVIYRYLLRANPTWIEYSPDVLTILFTWLIFLGIPRAMWQDSAVRIGIGRLYPKRLREFVIPVAYGAMAAYFAVLVVSYFETWSSDVTTEFSTLPLPIYVATLAIPVTSIASLYFVARWVRRCWRGPVTAVGLLVGALIPCATGLAHLPATIVGPVDAVVLLLIDCPVAIALGLGGATMVVNGTLANISIVASQVTSPTANITLLAIPLFLFMGALLANSTLARGLGGFVKALLGWLPGGVGVATVGTAAVFANITGSAVADTAAIGTLFIPEMLTAGYPPEEAAALQASAGVIGVIFPPAVAMILFASVASVNVTNVFEAVVIPGLMTAAGLMAASVWVARRRGIPKTARFSLGLVIRSLPRAVPVLLIPLILDGGIFSGVFTPAESGAVAIVVVSIFALAIGNARLANLRRAAVQAMDNTTLVIFILTSVALLDYGFVVSGAQTSMTNFLDSVGHSPLLALLVINLIFVVVHEFVDAGPAIVVMVPLVLPALMHAGVSPYQLAAVIAVNSAIGSILPPVGIPVYVASRLANIESTTTFRRVVPYVVVTTAVLVLITTIPPLSLWLSTGS